MFDGIKAPRRRITTREAMALKRMEHAAWLAECEAWRAEQKVLRVARKRDRYAEKVSHRIGRKGATCGDLMLEWIIQELNAEPPGSPPLPGGPPNG